MKSLKETYPPTVVNSYIKFYESRTSYFFKKSDTIKKYFRNISIYKMKNNQEKYIIFSNLISAIANSYIKMARIGSTMENNEQSQALSKEAQKELKEQLAYYYKNKTFTIEDWKKLAQLLRQVKNDSQLKEKWTIMFNAYQVLPKTLKSEIDLPDKSNVSVVDEIINQRLALKGYETDVLQDSNIEKAKEMIQISKSFEKREIAEEDVYSLLTRLNGKPFVITYLTSKNDECVRAGKLQVMNFITNNNDKEIANTVKDPLEAANRLNIYNNITYYDFSVKHQGYRTAKLSRTISISVGNFDSNIGITYIVKH